MAISEEARKNHDELFRGDVSTLKVTDPNSLTEYFDDFLFDEVLRDRSLDTRTRLMVQLAAIIACQALSEYWVMLGAALNVGVTPIEVKEIVYQAVPYVGLAKVFDFIHATNDVLTERGIELPLEGQSTTTPETREEDRKSTRLNSSHGSISYAVFCLKKKKCRATSTYSPHPAREVRCESRCVRMDGLSPTTSRSRSRCGLFGGFFFFNDAATTEIYTLSLHDALPI